LRADNTRLARAWLLAHLIAVVLIEASLGESLDAPLSGTPGERGARRASGARGNGRIGACAAPSSHCQEGVRPGSCAGPRDGDDHRQAMPGSPYPSAYGDQPRLGHWPASLCLNCRAPIVDHRKQFTPSGGVVAKRA
jgi:hypothetical protein